MASFTEAARKGQVVKVAERREALSLRLEPMEPIKEWAVASFNFGFLDDVGRHPDAWTKIEWDALWEQGKQKIIDGTLTLPFERCFYMFHFSDSPTKYEMINLYHLESKQGLMVGHCFSWSPSAPGVMSRWTLAPYSFVISCLDQSVDWAIDPTARLSSADIAEYEADARAGYTKVIAATMFLKATNHHRHPASSAHQAANNGRARGKLDPIPDILRVNLHRSCSVPATSASGSLKAPHERRGHYRTLADGREIPIKPALIHGGPPLPRTRVVTR